jgi:predicted ATPase
MELLVALVERAGELLSREELEARAWPTTIVEQTSLRVHLSALRRSLADGQHGARYITNVPGRGYCFVAPVMRDASATSAASVPSGAAGAAPPATGVISGNLPARLTSMVGRDPVVTMLVEQLRVRRLVTVLGPGGIGKTTVALAIAERARADHPVCFVDLSLVSDGARVPATVAAAFGLADFPDDPLGAITRLLGHRQVLLVLDNCEHLIDAAAALVSALLAGAPGLRLLATSRELIGLDGEWLHRLPALELPEPLQSPTAAQALACSAVQLFVERAGANVASFRLSDEDAPVAVDLCRRLGGIPLAIEVAAARLEQFGLRGLASQVDAGFLHLRRGRRTGLSRHEGLAAMLDWSHRLLSEPEQVILRRIGVFRSPFTLRSAIRVAADGTLSESDVVNGLAALRAKSLLNRVVLGDVIKHQMLEHTRVYALEKLVQSADEDAVRRRHALLVSDLLGEAQRNWPLMPKRQWMTVHGSLLLAIHTALKWAFSPTGDALIGASLTSVAWPVARFLFMEDFEASIRRAIEALERMADPPPMLLIRLYVGMATHLQEREGTGDATRAAYQRAAVLARDSDDPFCRIESEIGQIRDAMARGDCPRAVAIADRARPLARASQDEVSVVVVDRMAAVALHLHGDHAPARPLAQAVRDHKVRRGPLSSMAGVIDHQVAMDIVLARILWLEGCVDQAKRVAAECLDLAEMDSALAVSQTLALAVCPIALWGGDHDTARPAAARLLAESLRLASGQWLSMAQGYVAILDARPPAVAGPFLRPADAAASQPFPFAEDQLSTVDATQWHEASLTRANAGGSGWCAAEIWRRQALRRLARGASQDAEALLQQSLALAGTQGALSWQLRSATSLAQLWQQQGRSAQAHDLLGAILGRFTEGAGTRDRIAAAALLEALREPEARELR